MDKKVNILSLIREQKEVLFGRFSGSLTNENKIDAWKEVVDKARALGIYTKDWKSLRDVTWQNWKKRTMEKRDNRRRTGSGGSTSCIFDDADKLIFEIIGMDSPNLDGLPTVESSGTNAASVNFPTNTEIIPTPKSPKLTPKPKLKTIKKKNKETSENEMSILKINKLKKQNFLLELMAECKKIEIRKMNLEVLHLEQQLGIDSNENIIEYNIPERDVLAELIQNNNITEND